MFEKHTKGRPQPGVESSVACHVAARIYQGRDVTGIEPMTILVFLVHRKRLGLVVTETGMLFMWRETEIERDWGR
jgi:hypothetical protein